MRFKEVYVRKKSKINSNSSKNSRRVSLWSIETLDWIFICYYYYFFFTILKQSNENWHFKFTVGKTNLICCYFLRLQCRVQTSPLHGEPLFVNTDLWVFVVILLTNKAKCCPVSHYPCTLNSHMYVWVPCFCVWSRWENVWISRACSVVRGCKCHTDLELLRF